MKLELQFKNIVDSPNCKISVGESVLYQGVVKELFEFTCDSSASTLTIEQYSKQPNETIVENGVIVRDRSFELVKIKFDDCDIEELIWDSEFIAADGNVYKHCLFFGPNGSYVLNFKYPALRWLLESRHLKHNNDPTWEEDYNYYVTACKLVQQI